MKPTLSSVENVEKQFQGNNAEGGVAITVEKITCGGGQLCRNNDE